MGIGFRARPKTLAVIAVSLVLVGLASCKKPGKAAEHGAGGTLEDALGDLRRGASTDAIRILQGLVAADPTGRAGDRAALLLGNALFQQMRHSEAVPYLERAAKGVVARPYAAMLLVRAIVEGGLNDRFPEAESQATAFVNGERQDATVLLQEEAGYYLTKVQNLEGAHQKAADTGTNFLARWPKSTRAEEVRWLTAQSLRELGRWRQAHELYADIWFKAPGSPWAKESLQRLHELESAQGVPARSQSAQARYDFVKALQRAGLHQEALDEIDRYLSMGGPEVDGALYLRAVSLYALRRNAECVSTAQRLRSRYPRSGWAAAGGVVAIKALRRSNSSEAIREWAGWVHDQFPGSSKASEALYNLGVYLQNEVSEEEGTSVLERLVAEMPKADDADDSLWKVAWSAHRKGDDRRALATLQRLLDNYPSSGYRKAALYWMARLSAGQDAERAKTLYQTLLREFPNDYYGHEGMKNLLALGGTPGQIGNGKPFPSVDTLDGSKVGTDSEHYATAVGLKQVGLADYAARELREVPGADSDPSLQFALADLYAASGDTWKAAAIVASKFKEFVVAGSRDPRLVPREFWYICYPFNYRAVIQDAIAKVGLDKSRIDPLLVASLIRMESRFLPTAISPVGAVGLMQLMPDTAARIAQERGLPPPTRSDLFNPETNIRFGTYFLAQRVRDFGGDWFPAICSYNAGVDAVKGWWAKKPVDEPLDDFIESIPFVDTRLYIKQVLGDYRNYDWVYGQGS